MAGETEPTGGKPADQPPPQGPDQPDPSAGGMARTSPQTQLALQRAGTMQTAFAGLIPTSIGEAFVLAGYLAKSGAIPSSLRSAEAVFTVIVAGMELGLTPIRAVQSISNISGTLCMKADLQLALVKNRGVLAFYDEGFERFGQTDANLQKRITLALGKVLRKLGATDKDVADEVELVIEKLAAATSEGMKTGDPYGWAVGMRQADPTVHVRTFTFADAEKAIIYEKDDANPGAPKERKPLSQKFNYKSFPGDMYPKRARTRLLQILASDVTNGLPAVEAIEGGQVIDAEFTVHTGDPTAGDDVDSLLADMRGIDPEATTTIENGFHNLNLGRAARLQKLTQFKGKPKDLVEWLKGEYAARRGKGRQHPDVLGDEPAKTEPAKPAAPAQTAPPIQDAQIIQDHQAEQDERTNGQIMADAVATAIKVEAAKAADEAVAAERAAAAQPMTPARDLAARFRGGGKLKSF
jgi:hypothetical protein